MGRNRVVFLSSPEEMIEFGSLIGSQMTVGSVLALSGDLGVGKTTFVQGLAKSLAITDPIQSPTFVYLNEYKGTIPLFHFDLYRLKSEDDFIALGFDECFAKGVSAIEWSERIEALIPENALRLHFSHDPKGRIVEIILPLLF